jgi:RNA polymerase sigma-70 factor (ECF subfamily)
MEQSRKILVKARKGDKKAFEELLLKYDKKVYGYIFSLIHNQETALDLTQDTFIKVFEKLYTFDLEKNFSTWLFTIAKNNTFNYLKKQKKAMEIYTKEETSITADNNNPSQIYEKKEEAKELYSIIDKLPKKYKVLIYLKYIERLNYDQISEKLNIPVSTVESRLYSARQRLVKKINSYKSGGDF